MTRTIKLKDGREVEIGSTWNIIIKRWCAWTRLSPVISAYRSTEAAAIEALRQKLEEPK